MKYGGGEEFTGTIAITADFADQTVLGCRPTPRALPLPVPGPRPPAPQLPQLRLELRHLRLGGGAGLGLVPRPGLRRQPRHVLLVVAEKVPPGAGRGRFPATRFDG